MSNHKQSVTCAGCGGAVAIPGPRRELDDLSTAPAPMLGGIPAAVAAADVPVCHDNDSCVAQARAKAARVR